MAAVAAVVLTLASGGGGAAAPQRGSVVRIPFPQDDGSLTPYTFELGYPLMTLVYDTLEWRDPTGVAQPWLAQSLLTSADGRQITAHLVGGVRWQDGASLTSGDVTFTYDWIRSHPHPRFTGELENLDSVAAPDAATVVFHLRHPGPGFTDQPLADVPIMPRHLWAGLPDGQVAPPGLPVGSGPYRLVAHDASGYRFEANPSYFRGAPAVATLEVPVIHDVESTLQALETSRVDMLPITLPASAQSRLSRPGIAIVAGASYEGTVLLLNTRQAPFDDADVRRAVAAAVDVDQLARRISTDFTGQSVTGQSGRATPADHGYLHPASDWAAPEPLHRADPAAARAGLAPVQDTPLQLLVADNDPVKVEAAQQVAAWLSSAGATVQLQVVSRQTAAKAVGEDGSTPSFQMAVWSSPALASYDPDVLARLFGSDPDLGDFNYSGYRSAEFDALAAREASTTDPAQRRAAVTEELQLLATDAPAVPLFFSAGAYAYRSSAYAGWDFIRGTGILDKRSFVEPARQAQKPASAAGPIVTDSADTGPPLLLIGAGGVIACILIGAGVLEVARRRR